jgi:MGT family glycosyltransferase
VPQPAADLRPVALDAGGVAVPPWLEERRTRPRVAVTLGTVGPDRAGGVAGLVAALAPLDAEIVATVGSDIDPVALGRVPSNVHVAAYLPMSRLLPTSDLVVCHGGSGTVLAALASGIPLVMLPSAADQPENAARCAAAGVAIVLPPGSRQPQAVRDAVAAVLTEGRWSAAARRIQAEIAAMPAPVEVLPALEELAQAGPTGLLRPVLRTPGR